MRSHVVALLRSPHSTNRFADRRSRKYPHQLQNSAKSVERMVVRPPSARKTSPGGVTCNKEANPNAVRLESHKTAAFLLTSHYKVFSIEQSPIYDFHPHSILTSPSQLDNKQNKTLTLSALTLSQKPALPFPTIVNAFSPQHHMRSADQIRC